MQKSARSVQNAPKMEPKGPNMEPTRAKMEPKGPNIDQKGAERGPKNIEKFAPGPGAARPRSVLTFGHSLRVTFPACTLSPQ